MVIIAGCVIVREDKILMVKEAKKKCYGQWNFPARHVEEEDGKVYPLDIFNNTKYIR